MKIKKIVDMRAKADELEQKYHLIWELYDLGVPKAVISRRVGILRPSIYNILADPDTKPGSGDKE
jgi:hypothetical protein